MMIFRDAQISFFALLMASSAYAGWFERSPREDIVTKEQREKMLSARRNLEQMRQMRYALVSAVAKNSPLTQEQKAIFDTLEEWAAPRPYSLIYSFDSQNPFKEMRSPYGAAFYCSRLPVELVTMLIDALEKDEQGKVSLSKALGQEGILVGPELENWLKVSRDAIGVLREQKFESCKLLAEFLDKQIPLHEDDYQRKVAQLKEKNKTEVAQKIDEILGKKK